MNRARIVVDLGFGDAGKGSLVDYLAHEFDSSLVIRFNGGPQAAHNVCLDDGRHHTFSQFGSATFHPRTRTLLSEYMLIEPFALRNEGSHLASIGVGDALRRLYIDERALVISPPHIMANRLRERSRGHLAHGTCGRGLGECVADSMRHPESALRAGDLFTPELVSEKLRTTMQSKRAELEVADILKHALPDERRVFDDDSWIDAVMDAFRDILAHARVVSAEQSRFLIRTAESPIFEGAQGVLLDELYGFHPHTTWSRTTCCNANQLLTDCGWAGACERIGVTRSYATRHGNGPFPTLQVGFGDLHEHHNASSGWQGEFRVGPLDLVLLRYALTVSGPLDCLAVTHLDSLSKTCGRVCVGYQVDGTRADSLPADLDEQQRGSTQLTELLGRVVPVYLDWLGEPSRFIAQLEETLGIQARYESDGRTRSGKRRRSIGQ